MALYKFTYLLTYLHKSVLAMHNRLVLLCLKLVVAICELTLQLKTVYTELRYMIAIVAPGACLVHNLNWPWFTKGLTLQVSSPNPGLKNQVRDCNP